MDVDNRGGHAADVAGVGDETLPPETGPAEVMKQMSGTVQNKTVVGKRKRPADAMTSSQPDSATANEEPMQTYGLVEDLGVHQLQKVGTCFRISHPHSGPLLRPPRVEWTV